MLTSSASAGKQESARARFKLLSDALSGSKNVPKQLAIACRTQSSFAGLVVRTHGIEKVSLNTLKASADICIERGGWQRLDEMRRQYKLSLTGARKHSVESHPLKTDADALEVERRVRLRLETAYLDLLTHLAKLAATSSELADVLRRHQAGFTIERVKLVAGGRSDEQR